MFASEQNPPINWGHARTLKGFGMMVVMCPQPDAQTQMIIRPHLLPAYAVFAVFIGCGLSALPCPPGRACYCSSERE